MNQTNQMVIILAAVIIAFFQSPLAQQSKPQTSEETEIAAKKAIELDLETRKKSLLAFSTDLEGMMKSLPNGEIDIALAIDARSAQGATYMDATVWFVALYHRMDCDADRTVAKTVLENRLAFYAHMLDLAVDQTNGYLGLVHAPAIAQQGQRIRDELRAAKSKLDEIAASLK